MDVVVLGSELNLSFELRLFFGVCKGFYFHAGLTKRGAKRKRKIVLGFENKTR